ncbi:MAG: ABC transporter ATP-binding protein [bacterium]|nr:ABC transporter ATP-binding protein [bacterium]
MSFIELRDIQAGYTPGQPILKDFNLFVEQGELLSLLGPSGCGKTTTLRTIAGFIIAEKGRVLIGGQDYTQRPPNKRNIGLVFQNYALFPHLSVQNNVAYGLRRRKVPKKIMAEKIARVLELVSLTGFEDRLPAQLSGGQRQRVALARSIVIEPDLLLLDEPLSNLDAKLRDEMRAELRRLQHHLGITMIYVTHDQIEALSLSSRIIVMNEGKIEQVGTPEEIYEKPATSFVAKFVGFDNHLKGTIQEQKGDILFVQLPNGVLRCRANGTAAETYKKGEQVELFFRPEDALLSQEPGENSLAAQMNYATYQGNSIRYALDMHEARISVELPGKRMFTAEHCHLVVPEDKILIERTHHGRAAHPA